MKLKYKDLVDLQHELHSEYQASFMQLAKFIKLEDELSKPIGDDESYEKLLKDKESLIEPWLQVNLFEHFKADVVLKKREESQATNLLADLPGFLVFLPIVWTWLCLSQASRAFAQLGEAKPELTKYPFLTLWNQGFDGYLSPLFRFGEFASVAAFFAFIILIAILASSVYQNRKIREIDEQNLMIRNSFLSAISEIDRRLAKSRLQSPLKFAESLSAAADNLSSLQRLARESVAEINEALTTMSDASEALSNQSAGMKDGTEILSELLQGMNNAVASIETFMTSMPKLFAEMETTGKARISQELSGVLGDLGTTLKNRENWERGQISAVNSLVDYLGQKLPEYSNIGVQLQQINAKHLSSWKAIESELKKLHNAIAELQKKSI